MAQQNISIFPVSGKLRVLDGDDQVETRATAAKINQIDLKNLRDQVEQTLKQVSVNFEVTGELYDCKNADAAYIVVAMTGDDSGLSEAKEAILRAHPQQHTALINAGMYYVFDQDLNLKKNVEDKFTQVMQDYEVQVNVKLSQVGYNCPAFYRIDGVGEVEIEIIGAFTDVHNARMMLQIFFEVLAGRKMTSMKVTAQHLSLMCGRYLSNIRAIQDKTQSVFFLPCMINNGNEEVELFISSDSDAQLQEAQELFSALRISGSQKPLQKFVRANPDKLLMLDTMFEKEILAIATRWSCSITIFKDYCEVQSLVYATLGEACKDVANLLQNSVLGSFGLKSDVRAELKHAKTQAFIRIAQEVPATLYNDGSSIQMYCEANQFMKALNQIQVIDNLHRFISQSVFVCDMAPEYMDFITGKKNGKLIKIEKNTNVVLSFDEINPDVLTLRLQSNLMNNFCNGVDQLIDELPAEIQFYVPLQHHKRIIGIGGKNIQVVMKQYGVYIKFKNLSDFDGIGGFQDGDLNVMARTPAKNASNLNQLKTTVLSIADENYQNFVKQKFNVPLRYQYLFNRFGKDLALSAQKQFEVQIQLPSVNTCSPTIVAVGLKSKVDLAVQYFSQHIPVQYAYRLKSDLTPDVDKMANECFQKFTWKSSSLDGAPVIQVSTKVAEEADLVKSLSSLHSRLASQNVVQYPLSFQESDSSNGDSKQARKSSGSRRSVDVLFNKSFNLAALMVGQDGRLNSSAPNSRLSQKVKKLRKSNSASIQTSSSLTTPTRARPESGNRHLLKSAIGNSLLARSVSAAPFSPDSSGFSQSQYALSQYSQSPQSPKLHQLSISTGTINRDYQMSSFTARSPVGDSFNKKIPPGLKIETSTFAAGPYSAPLHDDPYENNQLLQSVVKSILSVNHRENKLSVLLDQLELSKYKQVMSENEVDFDMFLQLTEDDLKELGIPLGPRKKIKSAIAEIKMRKALENQMRHGYPMTPLKTSRTPPPRSPAISQEWNLRPTMSNNQLKPIGMTAAQLPVSPSNQIGFVNFMPGQPLQSPLRESAPNLPLHTQKLSSSPDLKSSEQTQEKNSN
ncbi:hypothetical protein MP228_000010 [Amoeboaphelidium protococcarum]|nr:hypothetical protein MP228_000010 [Amoeboaphelidium protococcarum]